MDEKYDEKTDLAEEKAAGLEREAEKAAAALLADAKAQRKRTIIMSMLSAGLVSLFVGHAFEVSTNRNGQVRSQKNCALIQDDRRAIGMSLKEQADDTLGSEDGKIKPFVFKGGSLEEFAPLIIAQARGQRERSKGYLARLQDCKAEFPQDKYLGFIG